MGRVTKSKTPITKYHEVIFKSIYWLGETSILGELEKERTERYKKYPYTAETNTTSNNLQRQLKQPTKRNSSTNTVEEDAPRSDLIPTWRVQRAVS